MIAKDIVRIVLYGIGLASLASLVYIAGPLIEIGGYRPLENYIVREIIVVLLVAIVASFGGFKFYRRKKEAKALTEGVSEDDKKSSDEVVLKDKMKDALATLKASSGSKKDYLYDLPWYVLIGPPGSGKTTALVNSGLKFPLSRGATPAAIAGVGGTRYCDWWFTEDAVLIDTAGRYTTHDSDAKTDKQSWFAFLDLLKKSRPRQPINGVMVAISLEDIMTLSASELSAHADAIRARLLELHARLKVDFPVYALFTKGDLVAGFVEYFGFLNETGRKQVWGATFQTADKTRNHVGEVPVEFDALLERLSEEQLDRLQDEPAPNTRVSLFGFAAQMARLKQPLFDFLNQIEPTRYHANATLRGFYFTSGTQEGTPIDQLIGSLAKSFGAEEVAPAAYSGHGKSYFLHDLILKVVIGEAAWVSTDRAAVRRAMILKAAALSAVALLTIGASLLWFVSYKRNSALIDQTEIADQAYVEAAGAYPHETLVADRDFHKILPLLDRLRFLPAGYGTRKDSTPLAATYGLSQRERLQSSAENVYRIGLERMFRSRMLFRLEEQLDANKANAGALYEPLKVYLMLGGQHPPDRELIQAWMRRDWMTLYPGSNNTQPIARLEDHLAAMLDLDSGEAPLIELDGRLIDESQRALARLSVPERAYGLLKSQALTSTAGDWTASRRGGSDVATVFETISGQPLDTVRVPEFFTYSGFHNIFLASLTDISERIRKERWVLGSAGEQLAVSTQFDSLPDQMLELYTRDFLAAWRDALAKLRLRKVLADKPKYIVLSALAAPTSPLKQLFESIRDETMLTRERPAPPPPAGGAPATTPAKSPVQLPLFKTQDRAPGANIEAQFRAFHAVLEGGATRAPIDDIIGTLNLIRQNLILSATTPSQVGRANVALQELISTVRNSAARLPKPFSDHMLAAVREFEGDVATSSAEQILLALRNQVIPLCQPTVGGRYPFTRGAERDVPLGDFAQLFAPNGVLDAFFTQYLKPHVDVSKAQWAWQPGAAVATTLSPSMLKSFQDASRIRDAYFPSGGNQPMISIAIHPPQAPAGWIVKFETGGYVITSPSNPAAPAAGPLGPLTPRPSSPPPAAGTPSPSTVQWPGASPRTAVSVAAEGGGPSSVLDKTGPWSLFRVLEAGSLSIRAETATATFIVGGQELRYQITAGSIRNPLNLAVLREFRCPIGN